MDTIMTVEDFEELGFSISQQIKENKERSKVRAQYKSRSYDLPIVDDDDDD